MILVTARGASAQTCSAGGYEPEARFVAGPGAASVAIGDYNGDGDRDLAVAGSSGVSILLGNGAGGFSAGASVTAGSSPAAVVAADFDGNGTIDLAVANQGSNDVS